ncbi:hypothetical protein GYMLUDRAFT_67483 [Collybiopsis luxurians FD-317 M1]|nr:hypothetical protein GYMLUDRAFT_67483 [Collybiopsis luxurians FD-317 M1]
MGRPDYENSGPPIAIFHPAFGEFKDDLHLDIEPSPQLLALAHKFIVHSLAIYSDEGKRRIAVEAIIGEMLGYAITTVVHEDKSTGDGSVVIEVTISSGKVPIEVFLLEFENEFGSGVGDPTVQAGLTARKGWAQEKVKSLRDLCCCPVFLMTIPGPYFMVSGAVFAERFFLEPLSSLYPLWGSLSYQNKLAPQVFEALRKVLQSLTNYYLQVATLPPGYHLTRCLPYIPSNIPQPQDFTFLAHAFSTQPWRAIFHATIGSDPVFVKYVTAYGQEAHTLLADHDLAPRLRFCTKIPGGLMMVVMDFIEGFSIVRDHPDGLNSALLERVQKAINLLHSKRFVFGDLRKANLMIPQDKPQKVLLVDFDWCGEEGKTRYPLLNPEIKEWHQEACPGGLIKFEHDQYMLQQLGIQPQTTSFTS